MAETEEIARRKIYLCKLKYPAGCNHQSPGNGYKNCNAIIGQGGEIGYCPYREEAILILQKDGER